MVFTQLDTIRMAVYQLKLQYRQSTTISSLNTDALSYSRRVASFHWNNSNARGEGLSSLYATIDAGNPGR